MRRKWRILLIFTLPLILSACTYTPSNNQNFSRANQDQPKLLAAQTYLQMAAQSLDDHQQQNYRLLAFERFVQDKKPKQALALVKEIHSDPITPEQQAQLQLLLADLQLTRHQTNKAIQLLQTVAANNVILNTPQQIKLHQLLAEAYAKNGKIADSLAEHSQALPLIQNQYAYNKEVGTAWKLLQQQNLTTLQSLMIQNPSPDIQGWLQLAVLTHQPNANGNQLIRNIENWRDNHRNHPANNLLPRRLDDDKLVTNDTPKTIAVLLPMSGALQKSASAIQKGFLAAYYEAKNNYQQTPTIRFYDTTQNSVEQIYQTALNDGADFIVGPLTKPNVEKLINSDLINRPTLALNTVSSRFDPDQKISLPDDLYQFGLSPIDEAIQIADIAAEQRHSSALIIAPDSQRGQAVAKAMGLRWQNLGGNVVADLAYNSKGNLSASIQRLLTVDLSRTRTKQLEKTIGQRVRSLPRRRQDIDCIFLVAKPRIGRQIQPLLKYFFAGDLPIFSTSEIYSGYANKSDQDLNDIIFTDMPWVLADSTQLPTELSTIQAQLRQLYPRSFRQYNKLYALGVDAYNVIPELNMLAILPKFGTNAATGTLYLDSKNHLYRQLRLAQIANGKPRMISHG